jgi:hypothetical protein
MKAKSIDEIVNTFITDLKKTKEYKEAWRNCYSTSEIVFNFRDKKFHNVKNEERNHIYPYEISMDEDKLLSGDWERRQENYSR